MNRRRALKWMLGTAGSLAALGGYKAKANELDTILRTEGPIYAGWKDDKAARQKFVLKHQFPFLSQKNQAIKGTGRKKQVFLWKLFEKATGKPLETHAQEIGDCVGHAYGLGIDVLTAVRMLMFDMPERWKSKSATEIIYAGSRVEVGHITFKGDGSMGVWAAEFIRKWGVLLRQAYLNGAYDFTNYAGQVARDLGKRNKGVPDELEPLTKLHPLKTCALVRSWEECRDAVANGYPVAMCSNVGFNTKRDRSGFLKRSRRPWMHAMVILGIDDKSRRPGALVQNSWGEDWVSGPTRHDQPVGSFWCDASTIDAAMRQGDSVALSGYVGYPLVDIDDYMIW